MPEMCLLSIRYLSLIEMSKTILETYVSRTEGRHIIFVIIEYDCRQSKKDIFEWIKFNVFLILDVQMVVLAWGIVIVFVWLNTKIFTFNPA